MAKQALPNGQAILNTGMGASGNQAQRDKRVWCGPGHGPFTDQHGREFEAQADLKNMRPTEEMRCTSHNPPWLPPMRFAKFPNDLSRAFRWDYDAMASELSGMTAAWYANARKAAIKEHWDLPEVGGVVSQELKDIFGLPPLSPEIPLSAQAEDPWLLGVPGASENAALEALLHQGVVGHATGALETIAARVAERAKERAAEWARLQPSVAAFEVSAISYADFVKECRGRKLSLAEIGKLWAEHKANLAAESLAVGAA